MIYNLRKIISYMLITVLLFILVGCGNAAPDDNSSSTRRDDWGASEESSETTTELATATTTEEKTTEKAEDDKASLSDADKDADKTTDKADEKTGSSDSAGDEDDNTSGTSDSSGSSGKGKLIVLDPGHSNIVTGNTEPLGPGSGEMKAADSTGTHGTTSGLSEIQLNFQIASQLRTELEARGYTVIMTRYDNDTAISCSERAKVANDAGADAFIRIHADGSESSSSSGAMAICITPSNPYNPSTYNESRALSDAVLNAYVESTGFSSRGVWETDTMTGNNWSTVPCTLIEMGFMTNPNEDSLMADTTFQQKMVMGIANGIDNYFSN